MAARLGLALAALMACAASAIGPLAAGRAAPTATNSVYADTLGSGWQDWSWDPITRNLAATSPVHGGNASIAVTYTGGWSGLQVGRASGLTASDFDTLRFWIHGGSSGGQQVTVYLQGQGASGDGQVVSPSANTWTELVPAAPIPAIRYGVASVWDPVTKELVSFAGFTSSGRFQDAWRLDAAAETWTDVTPAGPLPAARCLHTASYDAVGHRMIMYGGQINGAQDDIWAFDLAGHAWTNLSPPVRPLGRWFAVSRPILAPSCAVSCSWRWPASGSTRTTSWPKPRRRGRPPSWSSAASSRACRRSACSRPWPRWGRWARSAGNAGEAR